MNYFCLIFKIFIYFEFRCSNFGFRRQWWPNPNTFQSVKQPNCSEFRNAKSWTWSRPMNSRPTRSRINFYDLNVPRSRHYSARGTSKMKSSNIHTLRKKKSGTSSTSTIFIWFRWSLWSFWSIWCWISSWMAALIIKSTFLIECGNNNTNLIWTLRHLFFKEKLWTKN